MAHPNPLYKPLTGMPEMLFGAGIFSGAYGDLESDPADTVRRALYLGINYFDTSVLYGDSESILGDALDKVKGDYPREKYFIATKCGRYGYKVSDCEFTAVKTRQSVMRSLERLKTTYLDVVFAHDVEFAPSLDAVCGPGGIIEELFKLKDEGVLGHVGVSGYPLPVLLAVAKEQQAKGRPLDVVLSYCHFNLQNTTFASYASMFRENGVKFLINASPLCMGLLGSRQLPAWHPALPEMRKAQEEADRWCIRHGWSLGNLALRYALRNRVKEGEGRWDATLIGLRGVEEAESAAMHLDQVNEGFKGEVEFEGAVVDDVRGIFKKHGVLDQSWESPTERERDGDTKAIGLHIKA